MWLLCSFQGPPRGAPDGTRRRRSLKTQQHAGLELREMRHRTRGPVGPRSRGGRLAQPGSVDVLGRTVGSRWSCSAQRRPEGRGWTAGHGAVPCGSLREGLPRKEVIQPQLPLRLPCYDFTPVTSPTFDGSLP